MAVEWIVCAAVRALFPMARDDVMVDVYDDAKGGLYRRLQVLVGLGRRRKWSDEAKARIVPEALASGAVMAVVARRWQVCPQQIIGWRRKRQASSRLRFVPLIGALEEVTPEPSPAPAVELRLTGAMLRIPPGTDAALLTTVLRALRASAS
jgi:transposase